MNTVNKILLIPFALIIVVVVFFKFQQFFVHQDYLLDVNVNCDPETESCFQADCDTEDEACDITTYKKLELPARNAPECLLGRSCLDYSCKESDDECAVTFCSIDALEDGEKCASKQL